MVAAFSFLARHRWAGVGLAIVVETGILVPLAYADPLVVAGVPAAVAAAIAGTVAVVFGPADGALVAFVGAALFGTAGGWEMGELVALGVWPVVVVAAGLFARRVESRRTALAQLVAAQETERRRIALELHDENAQVLAAALLALKQAQAAATAAEAGAANETTHALIQRTMKSLRELAVDLRPKALDDFGLPTALEQLAAKFTERTGIAVDVDARTVDERLPQEAEITVFRAVQEVLEHFASIDGGGTVHISFERAADAVRVAMEYDGPARKDAVKAGRTVELAGPRERVRLAGGRLVARSGTTGTTVRVELPL